MTTLNFTGTVQGETFEDVALFEDAAKTWRAPKTPARKSFGMAPTKGERESEVRSIRRGWKAPAPKAFEDPTGLEIGAEIEFAFTLVRGEERRRVETTGQVWSAAPAPGSVWIATGEHYVQVSKRGEILAVSDARGEHAGRAAGHVAA